MSIVHGVFNETVLAMLDCGRAAKIVVKMFIS